MNEMSFPFAERLAKLPPYLFAALEEKATEARTRGIDVVDLTIGDPDIPAPDRLLDHLTEAIRKPAHHRYPSYKGATFFREAAARWIERHYGISVHSEKETVCLIGSKEGIAHFPLAFVNPGEVVLVPTPGYPVYLSSTLFAGGTPYFLKLRAEHGFTPDLAAIPGNVAQKAKLLFLNYPNNPTASLAPEGFFEEAVAWCKKYGVILCHDAAYADIYYEEKPRSILEIPGARDVAIEMHSLSKTYCMTGFRIGFAVGNAQLIAGLGKIKTNIDSGAFTAIQEASADILDHGDEITAGLRKTYRARRDRFVPALQAAGFPATLPQAAFYVWTPLREGQDSLAASSRLLEETGILATPGVGFGEGGEGYLRFTMTVPEPRLKEAIRRLEQLGEM